MMTPYAVPESTAENGTLKKKTISDCKIMIFHCVYCTTFVPSFLRFNGSHATT